MGHRKRSLAPPPVRQQPAAQARLLNLELRLSQRALGGRDRRLHLVGVGGVGEQPGSTESTGAGTFAAGAGATGAEVVRLGSSAELGGVPETAGAPSAARASSASSRSANSTKAEPLDEPSS